MNDLQKRVFEIKICTTNERKKIKDKGKKLATIMFSWDSPEASERFIIPYKLTFSLEHINLDACLTISRSREDLGTSQVS